LLSTSDFRSIHSESPNSCRLTLAREGSLTTESVTTHTGIGAPLRLSNVDTDQIIPAEYLKRVTRTGFEDGLFSSWRAKEPDFVLNRAPYDRASVLVTGPDFGTGSSRDRKSVV